MDPSESRRPVRNTSYAGPQQQQQPQTNRIRLLERLLEQLLELVRNLRRWLNGLTRRSIVRSSGDAVERSFERASEDEMVERTSEMADDRVEEIIQRSLEGREVVRSWSWPDHLDLELLEGSPLVENDVNDLDDAPYVSSEPMSDTSASSESQVMKRKSDGEQSEGPILKRKKAHSDSAEDDVNQTSQEYVAPIDNEPPVDDENSGIIPVCDSDGSQENDLDRDTDSDSESSVSSASTVVPLRRPQRTRRHIDRWSYPISHIPVSRLAPRRLRY